MKILLVQTANSNLGDNVIGDNHYYLLRKICGKKAKIFNYSIASRDVEQIRYVDAVVFAGGILKVTNEKFHEYIPEIINKAQEYNVPVYLSSIGAEKFYEDNEYSHALRDALNLPCVKGIAIRDDIETLKRDYIKRDDLSVIPCWDVAVWSKYTYRNQLPRFYRPEKNTVIGVGVVRNKLFPDYGHPEVTYEMQMAFWTGVINELEKRGHSWVLFTNGDAYDEEMARDVLAAVGHGEKLDTPLDGKALVKMISGFRGCIAGRMHSNIISYALGIPSIGFVWNQKLRFWSEKIGYPERFLECDNLDPVKAVELLEDGLKAKCGPTREMKNAVYNGLKNFIKTHVRKTVPKESLMMPDLENVLCANHLGSLMTKYPNTDSREAFLSSVQNGYRSLEVDLRLTTDGVLVCVNRWHKDTYKLLGIDAATLENPDKGIDISRFKRCRLNNRFHPITFDELLAHAGMQNKELNMVLAIGRPASDKVSKIVAQIEYSNYNGIFKQSDFIFRGEHKEDIVKFRKKLPKLRFMYYFVADDEMRNDKALLMEAYREAVEWCAKEKVHYIAVGYGIYDLSMISLAHDAGIKFCLNSNDKTDVIITAIETGADMVLNQTYPITYLKELLG